MFLEKEVLAIRKVQKDLDIVIQVESMGSYFVLNEVSSINIPGPIRCESVDEVISIVKRLDNQAQIQSLNSNVVYLYEKNNTLVENETININEKSNVIPFPTKKKVNHYGNNGYQLAESDPEALEKALLFVNNIHKRRDRYPAELEKIFQDHKDEY